MKCAVFPCMGLGDALIALILSKNLERGGHHVDTFHPFMQQMQPLFPGLPLLPRPSDVGIMEQYDKLFFFYEKLDWMQSFLKVARERFPEKLHILNPIATPNRDYPYWEEGRFDGTKPFVWNLTRYCKEVLEIDGASSDNGLEVNVRAKHPRRVILHPTSSRAGKNWSKEKFIALSERLERSGYEPVFLLTAEEKLEWQEVEAPRFRGLVEVAQFVAASGAMIGNDSGIGHLASNLGLPTVTICRSRLSGDFWRPAWASNHLICPPKGIPNLKFLRLRDKRWQTFVPVSRVEREFNQFVAKRG